MTMYVQLVLALTQVQVVGKVAFIQQQQQALALNRVLIVYFFTQSGSSKKTPRIISINATVVNNNPPASNYALNVISDTRNMSKSIDIALASGNSTSYIYRTNDHPYNVVEGSFYEVFSTSSAPVYIYVKISDGEGSCNMSVSATNSLFNMSTRTISESNWVQIGGGNVTLTTSSSAIITLTFTQS